MNRIKATLKDLVVNKIEGVLCGHASFDVNGKAVEIVVHPNGAKELKGFHELNDEEIQTVDCHFYPRSIFRCWELKLPQ
jgi:hypothetical protein